MRKIAAFQEKLALMNTTSLSYVRSEVHGVVQDENFKRDVKVEELVDETQGFKNLFSR